MPGAGPRERVLQLGHGSRRPPGQRGGGYNAYTGNYAARRARHGDNTNTGACASGGRAHRRQRLHGPVRHRRPRHRSRAQAATRRRSPASTATTAESRSVGNNVYADNDGNVYKAGGRRAASARRVSATSAGLSTTTASGSWGGASGSASMDSWDNARSAGDNRASNFGSSGWGSHSWGGGGGSVEEAAGAVPGRGWGGGGGFRGGGFLK